VKNILHIHPTNRFYTLLICVSALYTLGFFVDIILPIARISLLLLTALSIIEIFLILNSKVSAQRTIKERFSNGDPNPVILDIENHYSIPVKATILDEVPFQFQKRDFRLTLNMSPRTSYRKSYHLSPVERGVYEFGNINILIQTVIGLFCRRFKIKATETTAVYPSFFQLKKIELIAFSENKNLFGLKKIRQTGNNQEFEQIKEYVAGDDYRRINWKATARNSRLMINQYQDEKLQNVYQLIDMGRTMKMPFNGMTLLDYAINSSLAISNVIIKKNDRAGLITFSSHLHNFISADNKSGQLNKILETLYSQTTNFDESNLEQTYITLNKNTPGRSLIILYTNYESIQGMERQLTLLKKIARRHLVLLVSFINSELVELSQQKAKSIEDIYLSTIAEKNIREKNMFMDSLAHHGIINLRVRPDELTLGVLNKYLEIKNRGLL